MGRRLIILGQKEGLYRVLVELAQLKRTEDLDVLVISTNAQPAVFHAEAVSTQLHFPCRLIEDDAELFQLASEFKPDLIVSVLYPRRVKQEVLSLCECINFHPSLLPKHRGCFTQFWAVFENDATAGITCHRMVYRFDEGRILHQSSADLDPVNETALSLNRKLMGCIEASFRVVIRLWLDEGLPEGTPQPQSDHPYHYRKLPFGGVIQSEWDDETADKFIRAMYIPPYELAIYVDASGVRHPVKNIADYKTLRASATS